MTIQNFASRLDDPASRRFGTFSYLPPLTRDQVERQIDYMLAQGWVCSIEYVEPARAITTYWYMWRLPLFGANSSAAVMAELDECREAHPRDHVRLVAHDPRRQTLGLAIVVHRGAAS